MSAYSIAPPINSRPSNADAVIDHDSTQSARLYELRRALVEGTPFEMIPERITLLLRQDAGEHWASWGAENAVGDSDDDAARALWNQIGTLLDSLEADEANLSESLIEELREIRQIMRRRR